MTPPLSPITAPEAERRAQAASQEPRRGPRLTLDPVLTLTVLGLGICSVVVLGWVTAKAVPGQPRYYSERQIVYLLVGLAAMVALARIDYARLRHHKVAIYVDLVLSILAVLGAGSSAQGSVRAISFPLFSFQGSELGKVLLILALSALVVDRSRQLHERETTARVMLAALLPAMLVIAQPDLGSGLVYLTIAVTLLFVAGVPWRHLAGLLALGAAAIALVLVVAPAAGRAGAEALRGRTPYELFEPLEQSAERRLPAARVEDRDRRGAAHRQRRPTARRSRANSCPRTAPTSSSRRSASATASSARRWCSRCMRC